MLQVLERTVLQEATLQEATEVNTATAGQKWPTCEASEIGSESLLQREPEFCTSEIDLAVETNVHANFDDDLEDDENLEDDEGEPKEIAPELYPACRHPAGTTARIDTYIRRIEQDLPLWHPDDRHDYRGITLAVRQDSRLRRARRREVVGGRDAHFKAIEEAERVETEAKARGAMLQQYIDDDGLNDGFEQEMAELLRTRGLPKYNRREDIGRTESDSLALAGVVVVAGRGYKNPNSDFEGVNEARERAYQNALAAVEQNRQRQQGGASERRSVGDKFQSTPAPSNIAESSPEIPQNRPTVLAELPPGFGANTTAEEVSRLFADITPAQELLQSLQFYAEAVVKGTFDRDSYHGFVQENLAELQKFVKRRSINLASESQVVLREDTPALVVASMLKGKEISDQRLRMLKLYADAVVQGSLTQSEYKSFLAANPGILDSLVAAHSDGGLVITKLAASA